MGRLVVARTKGKSPPCISVQAQLGVLLMQAFRTVGIVVVCCELLINFVCAGYWWGTGKRRVDTGGWMVACCYEVLISKSYIYKRFAASRGGESAMRSRWVRWV